MAPSRPCRRFVSPESCQRGDPGHGREVVPMSRSDAEGSQAGEFGSSVALRASWLEQKWRCRLV